MTQHKLWLVKSNKMIDITPIVGNLSWRSNVDELGTELNFNLSANDIYHLPSNPANLGDIVNLSNGKNEITRCVLVTEDKKGRDPIGYKAFDFAFYLNKSKRVYQFNKVTATKAIQRICKDNKIPIHNIAKMNTKINKIYINDTLSDIIKDIIKQVEQDKGSKYTFEMVKGKFHVYKAKDILITPIVHLASNIYPEKTIHSISNPSKTRSIENMKNRIQLTSDGKLITTLSDDKLIKQYGLLSDIVDIDKDDKSKAKNIARNTLKELGRVLETTSLELIGHDSAMAGRLIEIKEPITGMKGKYLIESAQHNISNGIHTMSLDLKGV